MDPKDFGVSTLPLHHEPYGPILIENLVGANAGKVAVVTGAARGGQVPHSRTFFEGLQSC